VRTQAMPKDRLSPGKAAINIAADRPLEHPL
jgi:hypothetical protein